MALNATRRRIVIGTATLALLAAVIGTVLHLINTAAIPAIEANKQADIRRLIARFVAKTQYDNDPLSESYTVTLADPPATLDDTVIVYPLSQNGHTFASVWRVTATQGYSGDIELAMGVNEDGTLLGVDILNHHETPGLGDRIEATKSDWLTQFTGLSLNNPPEARWRVRIDNGDFDTFTGATITPRGVIAAIRDALSRRHAIMMRPQ